MSASPTLQTAVLQSLTRDEVEALLLLTLHHLSMTSGCRNCFTPEVSDVMLRQFEFKIRTPDVDAMQREAVEFMQMVRMSPRGTINRHAKTLHQIRRVGYA